MPLSEEDRQWILEKFERADERLERAEERMSERLEQVETRLLTEFHKWASPVELRQRSHAAAIRALDVETEALSDRLKRLEEQRERPQ